MIDLNLGKIFIDVIFVVWPLYVFIFAILIIRLLMVYLGKEITKGFSGLAKKNSLQKYQNWNIEQDTLIKLKSLQPKEFEEFISFLFSKLGYETEAVGQSHDGGIDVIAKKDGKISYIQCKKYISSQVSVGAMRDFYGAIANRLADSKAFFVTTNTFTLEAEKFAEDKPIELVDGFNLLKYIKMANILKEEIPQNNNTCPECGGVLILRESKFGHFYGCSNYPKCKYIKDCRK